METHAEEKVPETRVEKAPVVVYPRFEPLKLLFVFLLFLLAISSNHLALAVIHDIAGRDPLPDLLFDIIPQQAWAVRVADSICGAVICGSFLLIVALHRHRFIILRRMMYIVAVLYMMRAVSISVTQLPAPYENNYKYCRPALNHTNAEVIANRFFALLIGMGANVEDDKGQVLCGDMLFSGHTMLVSISTFMLNHYTPTSLWPLRWLFIVGCIVGLVCVVISHMHYSIDVIVAYWIATMLFSVYHALCDLPVDQRPKSRMFRRLVVFWTIYELEKHTPHGRLPNELEWPLPWPAVIKGFFEKWNIAHPDCSVGKVSRSLSDARLNTHI